MKRVKIRRLVWAICSLVAVSAFVSPCSVACSYRPFVSTDAAVAGPEGKRLRIAHAMLRKPAVDEIIASHYPWW